FMGSIHPPRSTVSPQPVRRPRLRILVTVCGWLYLMVVLGVWLLLGWADTWWLATLAMFAPRWLLAVPLVVLVPAALVVRPRTLWILGVTTLLISGPVMGFCIPWQVLLQATPRGPGLRVLTCNMHSANVDPAALDALVDNGA